MSSEAKHTPGPWKVGPNDTIRNSVDYFEQIIIAFIGVDVPAEASTANASCAAAPALLEALEKLTEATQDFGADSGNPYIVNAPPPSPLPRERRSDGLAERRLGAVH